MKIRIYYALILTLFWSCKSREITSYTEWLNNSEILVFDCPNKEAKECINEKYNLSKIYESAENFKIEQSGKIIFKANEKGKYFIYEVYESNYLLVYEIPIPNHFASPFGHSKSFYLCDLNTKLTYHFNIGNYSLSPTKPNKPVHASGTKSTAFIANINTEKQEVNLMFSDLETEEKIHLQLIAF